MHKGVVANPESIIDEIMEKLLNNLEKRWSGAFIYPLPTPTYFYSESQGAADYPCMQKWWESRAPVHHRINTRHMHSYKLF